MTVFADEPAGGPAADSAWSGIRTILVPQDIVGVCPRAPGRTRRNTPCRFESDGQAATPRAGDRDWFSDRLFVESQEGHARSGYGTSITVHVCLVAALVAFLFAQPDVITIHMPSLPMPAMVAAPPPPALEIISVQAAEQPKPKTLGAPAPPPPAPAEQPDAPAPAPVEAPASVTPETGAESRNGGVPGGVAGGVTGGVVGGVVGGIAASGSGSGTVVRVGAKMQPPRKIKDVKPIYPDGALPSRSQGAVVLEATIGPDGKVKDVKVIHSVPALNQAAIDAVRQWEYTPSVLNGAPVSVVMTVVVNFALQ